MDLALYQASSSADLARQVSAGSPDLNFYLGLKLADEQNFEGAIAAMEAHLAIDPQHTEAAYYLGRYNFRLRRYGHAERAFSQVGDRGDRGAECAVFLGEICRHTGRLTSARKHYQRALRTGQLQNPVPHLGLSALLMSGVELGFPSPAKPLVDEQLAVRSGSEKVYTRLRIFRDLRDSHAKVVLFTDEADSATRGRAGISTSNGAESLIEFVLNESIYAVCATRTTWIVMHEAGGHGVKPMHASRLSFALTLDAAAKPSWLVNFCSRFGYVPRHQPAMPRVCDLSFRSIDHPQLEAITGQRFYWG